MNKTYDQELNKQLEVLKEAGTFKKLRHLTTPMGARVAMEEAGDVIVLSSNNYLGLANSQRVIDAGIAGLKKYGAGTSSVRFICGTQSLHKQLEARLSDFLGTEDTILYSSCFDANGGLFETLLDENDAVISDELNHASIIDGIRLCKAARFRYRNSDMADLEAKLKEASGALQRLIATDGVFSMEGSLAPLPDLLQICREHDAVLVIDDDAPARELMFRYLSKEHFRVLQAASGEEGLEMARELRPRAITLDVIMPGLDGWQVLHLLKTDPLTRDIPVILVSIVDQKDLGFRLAAADYVVKPFDRDALIS